MSAERYNILKQTMIPVRDSFERLGVAYAVGGSVAGIAHGFSRFTMDIDVVAELKDEHVDTFVRDLEHANFYVDEYIIRDAIRHKRCFDVIDEITAAKIDICISKEREWDKQMLDRRIDGYLGEDSEPAFAVETTEDYVLSKLSWYRQTGNTSDRQWNDILAVLKIQFQKIDTKYLNQWAASLGVADLLEKALDESGFNE